MHYSLKLSPETPESQLLAQKKIQGTSRASAGEYTAQVGALSAYVSPELQNPNGFYAEQSGANYWVPPHTRWNQMSDRVLPAQQTSRSPGVDIKHGSYERYLLRLKGRGLYRSGINVSRAQNTSAAKFQRTALVAGCACPGGEEKTGPKSSSLIAWCRDPGAMANLVDLQTLRALCIVEGSEVWARSPRTSLVTRAKVCGIRGGTATISFCDQKLVVCVPTTTLLLISSCPDYPKTANTVLERYASRRPIELVDRTSLCHL